MWAFYSLFSCLLTCWNVGFSLISNSDLLPEVIYLFIVHYTVFSLSLFLIYIHCVLASYHDSQQPSWSTHSARGTGAHRTRYPQVPHRQQSSTSHSATVCEGLFCLWLLCVFAFVSRGGTTRVPTRLAASMQWRSDQVFAHVQQWLYCWMLHVSQPNWSTRVVPSHCELMSLGYVCE